MNNDYVFSNIQDFLNENNFDNNFKMQLKDKKILKEKAKNFFDLNNINLRNVLDSKEKNINPFDLDLLYCVSNDYFFGYFNPIFKDKKILYKNIELNRIITALSPAVYVHELIHTQTLNIENIGNMDYEVLSVFIDKLYCFMNNEENIFLYNQLNRLNILKRALNLLSSYDLDDNQLLNVKMIISSILKSEHLFFNYTNGINSDRIKIMNNIQNVIDEKTNISDMLDFFDIKLYNSVELLYMSNNLKLAKKMSR